MTIATNPVAGDLHVNVPLTNFGQKYLQSQDSFVGMRAMPNIPVQKQSDLYWVFNREDFFRDEMEEKADGSGPATGEFNLSTNPYFAKVYAFAKTITDRQRVNQDQNINLEQSAAEYVMHKALIKKEVLFRDAFISTGKWATDAVGGTDFTKWGASGSNPIVNIRDAIRTVQQDTGRRPNKMVIGRTAYDKLLDTDVVLDRIIGGATADVPATVQRRLLAQLFELQEIFVMDAVVNTAKKGASESETFIGGNDALVYYAPNAASLIEPTAGAQFSWTGYLGATPDGMRIKRYRLEESRESDQIEAQMAFDYKVIAPELGYFFSDAS